MTKREDFNASDEAVQRGEWLNRQSKEMSVSSENAIRKSRETLKAAQDIKKRYKGSDK